MIGRLRGEYVERNGANVVVDCGGVGYEAHVSACTLAEMGKLGDTVTLQVFTHAQENKIALYGFSSRQERALFDLLITVKNVGPSSAIKILSAGAGPNEIARMIANESVAMLTGIKGVGKKTAELLVVELHEKCAALLMSWGANNLDRTAAAIVTIPGADNPLVADVSAALTQLGWRQAEVDKAVAGLDIADDSSLEDLLRQALRSMAR